MKTLNSIMLVATTVAVLVSCTCNGSKKTLSKEQLIEKKFDLFTGNLSYDMIYGRWVSEDGEDVYEFLPNKYDDIICVAGHHHESPECPLFVYYRDSSGDPRFLVYETEILRASDGTYSFINRSDFWGDGPDDILCLDATKQFMQEMRYNGDAGGIVVSDWGKRYYKESTSNVPTATQEEINEIKAIWDNYCSDDF